MSSNIFKQQKGFGLIEVVVSIYIIVMAFIGILSLVKQGIQVQYINKNTIIAAQLAQEGLELVRNVRDNNWRFYKKGANWKQDIIGGAGGAENQLLIIDYRGKSSIETVDSIDNAKANLKIDSNGFYSHDVNGEKTIFSRVISKQNTPDNGLRVVAEIKWNERGNLHNYKAETLLYDWKFPN